MIWEISVKAIIEKDGKYLILYRGKSPILPGGRVEKGETLEEALIREIKEEINCEVKEIKGPIDCYKLRRTGKIYIYYLAKINEDCKIKLSEEHDSYKWVSYEELPKYVKRVLEKLNEEGSKNNRI